jgi:dihydrofolate reductase
VGRLVYSMNVSLDGYAAGPNGDLGWSTPDEELHRYWNDAVRETEVSLYGRRLYELMSAFWPTADQDPSAPDYIVEFARVWLDTPKVVFSHTLERVEWNSRLVRGDAVEEVVRLKAETTGDLEVGGPTLAASLLRAGLIDEVRPVVHPVIVGAGLPFFPALDEPRRLRLVETRPFASGVVALRYETLG